MPRRRSYQGESNERPSAEALARNFQKIRGPVSTPIEPMEVDEVPLEQPARVRGSRRRGKAKAEEVPDEGLDRATQANRSSQKEDEARLDRVTRGKGSSHRRQSAPEEFSREKREIARGKKPEEGSTSERARRSGEAVTKQPGKSKKEPTAEEYLAIFLERGFAGTRYPHRETCARLGILKDVEFLYRVSGLGTFMRYHLEAYQEETCHFLSSLSVHFYDNEPDVESDGGPGFITFTCRGVLYSLTIKELEKLYGFPSGMGITQEFDNAELQSLWSTIGDDKPYSSSRTKASKIRSPVLRYFHKAIASTLYARQVTGNINDGEMQMIDVALQDVLAYTRNGSELLGNRADTGLTFILLSQLMWYKDWALRMNNKKSAGELSIGGVITPILVACGVELRSEPHSPRWIDIDHLRRSSFLDISQPPEVFVYQFTHPAVGEAKLRLPCTDLTSVRVGANIDFAPPIERLYTGLDEAPMPEDNSGNSEDSVEDDGSRRFGFEDYPLQPKSSPALKEAHKRIGILQRWNKFQGKTIAALKGTVKDLKGQMKEVRDQLRDFQQKLSGPSSRKVILPKRVLLGSSSFREAPRPSASVEPPRASSFEPRQPLKQYARRKRSSASGNSSSSTQLEPSARVDHPPALDSSSQLESSPRAIPFPPFASTEPTEQHGRALPFPMFHSTESIDPQAESSSRATYTRESMEDSISSFFSNP